MPVLCLCGGDARYFAYLHQMRDHAGWTAIRIDVPSAPDEETDLSTRFGALSTPEDVSLTKAGKVMHGLSLRIGTGFVPP